MSSIPVYIGFWHDYSHGQDLNWTLTLSIRWSGYLTAALSTFVGIVGACFWNLLSFAIHQCRAKRGNADTADFQQQVIYRNPSSPLGTVIQLVKIAWAWRGQSTPKNGRTLASRIKTRSFCFSLPPLLSFIAFTAAGVFIGEVTNPTYKSNNVRVEPTQCGMVLYNTQSIAGLRASTLKTVNDTLSARAYASNCYESLSSLSQCSLYPKASLTYNSNLVECPFGNDPSGQSLCTPSQALNLDTGLLDSNDDLGINTPSQNRISFRKSVTCSPIQIQSYIEISSEIESGYVVYNYFLGPFGNISNWTFQYDSHTQADGVGYQIFPYGSLDNSGAIIPTGSDGWVPIPALNVTHADTTLIFLETNSILYLEPVQDPWFQAINQINITISAFYEPNNLVSAMACTDQYQICNPASSPERCTILGSISDLEIGVQQIGLNDYQGAIALRLLPIMLESFTFITIQELTGSALLAPAALVNLVGQGLPDNQWQLEMLGWFETELAKIQAYTVSWAAKTADFGPYGYVLAPNSSGDPVSRAAASLCSNQRIRNTGGYQSFSVLGLLIITCVGGVIIIFSLTAEVCVEYAAKRKRRSHSNGDVRDYKEIARVAHLTLQLQRMALTVAAPNEHWLGDMGHVPVIKGDLQFSLVESEEAGFHYKQETQIPSNANEFIEMEERNPSERPQAREGLQEPLLTQPIDVSDEGAQICGEVVDTNEEVLEEEPGLQENNILSSLVANNPVAQNPMA